MHIYMYVYYIWASLMAQWWRICQQCRWPGLDPWVRKSPWRREWQPTPVLLPGKSPWMEEVDGLYSPWGHKESDMTLCVCMYVCVRERAQNSGNKHCLQVQSLWKTVWETHQKKKIGLPYDPPIPLLGIYPKGMKTLIQKYIFTLMFIFIYNSLAIYIFIYLGTLFTIAKPWANLSGWWMNE